MAMKDSYIMKITLLLESCTNPEIGQILKIYTQQVIIQQVNIMKVKDKYKFLKAWSLLLNKLHKFNVNNITWNNYCILTQYTHNFTDSIKTYLKVQLPGIFKFIIDNITVVNDSISDLIKYKYLLDVQERPFIIKDYRVRLIQESIYTNFPVNSTIESIYYYKSIKDKEKASIINLNTSNKFLKELLIEYIGWLNTEKFKGSDKILNLEHRIFVYHFEDSFRKLPNNIPQNIEDITFHTYKSQLHYYAELTKSYCLKNKFHGPDTIIKEFYIFLIDYTKRNGIDYNIFFKTNIDRDLMLKTNFNKWVLDDYSFSTKSAFEDMPNGDKWLLADDSRAIAHKTPKGFDFTLIKDSTFKNTIKEWVWYLDNVTVCVLRRYFGYLVDFLNVKYNFDVEHKNVKRLFPYKQKSRLTPEFMFYYRTYSEKKYMNQGTRENAYKAVRSFLNFYKDDFENIELLFKYIPFKDPKPSETNPVSKEDWNLIKDKFREFKDNSIEDELYYNIFYLKSTTHLRIGEILNLERNCIIKINEEGQNPYGKIQHFSKTTKDVLKLSTLSLDKIRIIQRSIKITQELSNDIDKESTKKYIFIKKHNPSKLSNSFNIIKICRIDGQDFEKYFYKLQELSLGEVKYTTYNLRHMFKDEVWKQGTKEGLSIQKIEMITGTKYYTDIKHYRSRESLMFYIEAIAGTTISDIDIDGNFITEDLEVEKLNPVHGGLGGCNNSNCISEIKTELSHLEIKLQAEDKCLICNNFKTSVSRIFNFEKKILSIENELESANTEYERQILISRKKIHAYHLQNLIAQKEGFR